MLIHRRTNLTIFFGMFSLGRYIKIKSNASSIHTHTHTIQSKKENKMTASELCFCSILTYVCIYEYYLNYLSTTLRLQNIAS